MKLNLSALLPPFEEIERRQILFQQSLVDAFVKKLSDSIKVKKFYSHAGKFITATGATAGVIVGAFTLGLGFIIAPIAFIAGQTLNQVGKREKNVAQKRRNKAKHAYEDYQRGYELWEVAKEASYLFEYQIVMLKDDDDIKTMAAAAADRMLAYLEKEIAKKEKAKEAISAKLFDKKVLLMGLLLGESQKPSNQVRNVKLKTRFPQAFFEENQFDAWNVEGVFSSVGLRVKGDHQKFRQQPVNILGRKTTKAEKYGYRRMLSFENDLDKRYTQSDVLNDHQAYTPIMVYITADRIKEYAANHRLPEQDPNYAKSSLNEYIAARYYKGRRVKVVCNDNLSQADLQGLDLRGVDFSGTNLKGALLQNAQLQKASLIGANLTDSHLESVHLEEASLLLADLTGAYLDGANLSEADLRYAKLDNIHFTTTFYLYKAQTEGMSGLESVPQDKVKNLIKTDKDLHDQFIALTQRVDKLEADKEQEVDLSQVTNIHLHRLVPHYHARTTSQLLEQALEQSSIVLITGIAGCGKTQLATEVIQRLYLPKDRYHIWHFRADTLANLMQDFRAFALALGMSPETAHAAMFALVAEKLKASAYLFILFFDNVDSPEVKQQLKDYLPSPELALKGKVIITSQDSHLLDTLTNNNTSSVVDAGEGFTEEEAIDFLTKDSAITEDEAFDLAEQFSRLPLGLAAAKLYINKARIDVKEYLKRLSDEETREIVEEDEDKLLKPFYRDKQNGARTQRAAIRLAVRQSLEAESKRKEELKTLLSYFALLATEDIPGFFIQALVQHIHQLSVIDKKVNTLADHYLIKLEEYSLIKVDGDKDQKLISLHRITQQAMIAELLSDPTAQYKMIADLLELTKSYFTKDTRDSENFQRNIALFSHVDALLKQSASYKDRTVHRSVLLARIKLLDTQAFFYSQRGMAQESVELFLKAKALYEQLVGIKMPDYTPSEAPEIFDKQVKELYERLRESDELVEAYISLCYSLGRVYFYTKDQTKKLMFVQALQLAYAICQAYEQDKHKKWYHQFLVENNGLLYLCLEKEGKTADGYANDLQVAVKRYHDLLERDNSPYYYYERGKVRERYISRLHRNKKEQKAYAEMTADEKRDWNNELYNEMSCHLQLARTYQKLAELPNNTNNWQALFDTALAHMKQVLVLIEEQRNNKRNLERLADYYNTYGYILLAYYDKQSLYGPASATPRLEEAKAWFDKAYQVEQAKNNRKGKRDFPLADAHAGLAMVYLRQEGLQILEEAEFHIEECLAIRQAIYPAQHPGINEAKQLQQTLQEKMATTAADTIRKYWRFFKNKKQQLQQQALSSDESLTQRPVI